FEELKGATFGVSRFGSAGHFATSAAAEAAGWTEDDYSVQPVGSLSSLQAALKNGAIDAFLWSGTGSFTMEADGAARTLESVAELVGHNAMTIWGVSSDLVDPHSEVVRDVMGCIYSAVEELQGDEDEALAMLDSWGFEPEVAQRVFESEMQS